MQVRSDDIQLYYQARGEGFPVVLLHPFTVHHEFWDPIAGKLQNRYRLLTPDLRAHGRSEVGQGPATMAKHTADLLHLLKTEEIKKAVLVGVSIGGYILFEFWRRHRERVAALVLCDTKAAADTTEARANPLKAAGEVG